MLNFDLVVAYLIAALSIALLAAGSGYELIRYRMERSL